MSSGCRLASCSRGEHTCCFFIHSDAVNNCKSVRTLYLIAVAYNSFLFLVQTIWWVERERYRGGSEAIWGLLAFCIYTTGFYALQKILLWTVSLCVSIGHTQRQNNSFNRSFECLLSVHISNLSLNSYIQGATGKVVH